MFGVVERNIGCILNLFQKPQSMICLQTPSFGWSFQDGRQLASKPAHHKQRVARSSQISGSTFPRVGLQFFFFKPFIIFASGKIQLKN